MQLLLEKKLQKWKKFSEKSLAINSRRWNRYYIFSFNSKCFDNNWEIWPDKKVSIPRSFSILVQIVIFLSLLLLSTFSLWPIFNFQSFYNVHQQLEFSSLFGYLCHLFDRSPFNIGHWKWSGAVHKSCHNDNPQAGWVSPNKSFTGQKVKSDREPVTSFLSLPAVSHCPRLVTGGTFPNVKLHHNANGILSKVETQYDGCLNRVRGKCEM